MPVRSGGCGLLSRNCTAMPMALSSWRENMRFCRFAVRVSWFSAAASASALVGLASRMPSCSGGMSVSAEASMAMVSSMSPWGCIDAWETCLSSGMSPLMSRLIALMLLTSALHVSCWKDSRLRPRNHILGTE